MSVYLFVLSVFGILLPYIMRAVATFGRFHSTEMGNLANDVLRATLYLCDKIKSKSALKARTVIHLRDEGHACYWYRLSMYLYRRKMQRVQIKPLHCRNFHLIPVLQQLRGYIFQKLLLA